MSTVIKKITQPIINNLPFYVICTLFMGIASCLTKGLDGFHFAPVMLMFSMLQASAIAILLAYLVSWIGKQWLKLTIVLICALLCSVELFCFFCLGTRFNNSIVLLILQTNGGETFEFIDQYLLTLDTLLSFFPTTIITLLYYFVDRKYSKKADKYSFILSIICLLVIVISIGSQPFVLQHKEYKKFRSTPFQIAYAISQVSSHGEELEELTKSIRNITINGVTDSPEEIILVIGESFNKHHSNLYGYHHNTNPRMKQEADNGNLTVFKDVIATNAATNIVYHQIMSTYTLADTCAWENKPLFPAIFRKAGYYVTYLDNQAAPETQIDLDFSCFYFLNPKEINDACFDFRNDKIFKYDAEILKEWRNNDRITKPKLTIIHLMGQHMGAASRFPKEMAKFTVQDYPDSFTSQQRKDLANYDNAVYYNDYLLGEIFDRVRDKDAVVIFFSDHGEEIHDFRNRYGRSLDETPESLRCTLEVPFIIWCSDKFIANHSAKSEGIRQGENHKILNSFVAQTLLDLGGIDCPYFQPEFSVINKAFKPYKRIIHDKKDYDIIHKR